MRILVLQHAAGEGFAIAFVLQAELAMPGVSVMLVACIPYSCPRMQYR